MNNENICRNCFKYCELDFVSKCMKCKSVICHKCKFITPHNIRHHMLYCNPDHNSCYVYACTANCIRLLVPKLIPECIYYDIDRYTESDIDWNWMPRYKKYFNNRLFCQLSDILIEDMAHIVFEYL